MNSKLFKSSYEIEKTQSKKIYNLYNPYEINQYSLELIQYIGDINEN